MRDLPTPLTYMERSIFSQMYQRQPYLGSFPLALVIDRSELLKPVLLLIWEKPLEKRLWQVLWRLLDYYAEMSAARREADRRFKAKPKGNATSTQRRAPPKNETSASQLADCADLVAVRLGVKCKAGRCKPTFELHWFDDSNRLLVLKGTCSKHGPLNVRTISVEEASAIVNDEADE